MSEKEIDCSGFNFHCPENRSYVIFDPQSQEENDRLDALLGAKAIWEAAVQKYKSEASPGRAVPFVVLKPVGWTSTDEVVSVVVQGVIGMHDDKSLGSGGWFAVRCKPGTESELQSDLQARLKETQAFLEKQLRAASGG
jgi:hypothetical protein